MRAWKRLLVALPLALSAASVQSAGKPPLDLDGLKRRAISGFTLKSTRPGPNRLVEEWKRSSDGALLRIEIIPRATDATVNARLKAVNSKIPAQGVQSEELMFRYQTSPTTRAWTNYRATHHITFKTYRFWRLQNGVLVMADVSFPRGKPDFDAARGAFIAAKKAADGTMKALAGRDAPRLAATPGAAGSERSERTSWVLLGG